MRRSRVALLFFLGTFATGLYTADIVPPPRSVAADFGPRSLGGPRSLPAADFDFPDWCLPSPAIDALAVRRDAPTTAAKYAPAARKVTGRVTRDNTSARNLETARPTATADSADLACSAQLRWTCPLVQPLTETELERGARPRLAMREIEKCVRHPADLPRGEVLASKAPSVVVGNLAALARDPRHSTGIALALRLNAAGDGLSRRVATARPRDSYSRRYDYPFAYDCRLPGASRQPLAASMECNADDTYATARALTSDNSFAAEAAADSGIEREDLLLRSPARALGVPHVVALLAAGARLARDLGASAAEWRAWLVELAASAAAANTARADAADEESPRGAAAGAPARPAATAGAYLGL